MISERKARANRENARASTGPRTAAGKKRAAHNAQRHGLTVSVLADPSRAIELKECAREIAGDVENADLQELASLVAAAQVDLMRAQQVRRDLLWAILSGTEILAEGGKEGDEHIVRDSLTSRLAAVDRYERRAWSRRKFAIRAFDAAQALLR